jgi:surfeit locus 1 family protein
VIRPPVGVAVRARRSPVALVAIGLSAFVLFAGLTALGTWQLQRRVWKLDLIQRVSARVHASPEAAAPPSQWPTITAVSDEYRHVRVTGVFRHDLETPVQAVTALGSGFWIVTPLKADDGFFVLVNRGFVPTDRLDPKTRLPGQVAGRVIVTGLLRITEPGGGFLRANAPAAGRWYSRDVGAIAAARGLGGAAAPYFIDADASPNAGGWPVGGLTVIAFPNSHLIYAIIWYGLAGLEACGFWILVREETCPRQPIARDGGPYSDASAGSLPGSIAGGEDNAVGL